MHDEYDPEIELNHDGGQSVAGVSLGSQLRYFHKGPSPGLPWDKFSVKYSIVFGRRPVGRHAINLLFFCL